MKKLFVIYGMFLVFCDVLIACGLTALGWGSLDAVMAGIFVFPVTIIMGLIYYFKKIRLKYSSGYKLLEIVFFLNFLVILSCVSPFLIMMLSVRR